MVKVINFKEYKCPYCKKIYVKEIPYNKCKDCNHELESLIEEAEKLRRKVKKAIKELKESMFIKP